MKDSGVGRDGILKGWPESRLHSEGGTGISQELAKTDHFPDFLSLMGDLS